MQKSENLRNSFHFYWLQHTLCSFNLMEHVIIFNSLVGMCIGMQVIHSFEGEAPGELTLAAGDYVVVRQV